VVHISFGRAALGVCRPCRHPGARWPGKERWTGPGGVWCTSSSSWTSQNSGEERQETGVHTSARCATASGGNSGAAWAGCWLAAPGSARGCWDVWL